MKKIKFIKVQIYANDEEDSILVDDNAKLYKTDFTTALSSGDNEVYGVLIELPTGSIVDNVVHDDFTLNGRRFIHLHQVRLCDESLLNDINNIPSLHNVFWVTYNSVGLDCYMSNAITSKTLEDSAMLVQAVNEFLDEMEKGTFIEILSSLTFVCSRGISGVSVNIHSSEHDIHTNTMSWNLFHQVYDKMRQNNQIKEDKELVKTFNEGFKDSVDYMARLNSLSF